MAAYHTICTKCAGSDKAFSSVMVKRHTGTVSTVDSTESAPPAASDDKEPYNVNNDDKQEDAPTINNKSSTSSSSKRKIRVCAMCTSTPALSKYSYNATPIIIIKIRPSVF